MPRPGVPSVRDMNTMIMSAPQHVSIVSNDDVDLKVENIHIPSKTTSIIEDISVDSDIDS